MKNNLKNARKFVDKNTTLNASIGMGDYVSKLLVIYGNSLRPPIQKPSKKIKMDSEEELESCKIIADYMGWIFWKNGTVSNPQWRDKYEKVDQKLKPEILLNFLHDWSWLMPVVIKLSKDYDFYISWYDEECSARICNRSIEHSELCSFGNFEPPIHNVFYTIVKFLKKLKSEKK